MMAVRYYRVEVVCDLLEMPRSQLKRYERAGLLPAGGEAGPSGGRPRYSEADLQRARRIRRLERDLGLNLAGVQVVLHLLEQVEMLRGELEALKNT